MRSSEVYTICLCSSPPLLSMVMLYVNLCYAAAYLFMRLIKQKYSTGSNLDNRILRRIPGWVAAWESGGCEPAFL